MPNFIPRYYQVEAVQATLDYIAKDVNKHPLIECPTGSGKSHIIAMLCQQLENKVLVLSHVKEILEQDIEKLEELLDEEIGVYSAGLGRKDIDKNITVGGIQSIYKNIDLFEDIEYIIIDEAHTIPKEDQSMYRKVISALSHCVVIGLTATPFRLSGGYLHKGEDKLFNDIVYRIDVVRLIKEGYLCPLITKNADKLLDTDKVRLHAGDFSSKDMSKKFDKFDTTNAIVEELTIYRRLYKHWLLFAIDIEHAEHIKEALIAVGITADVMHSKRTNIENEYAKWEYKNKNIQCLISVAKLTTGFDAPHTDLIALVRPTKSPVLHVQMIGRGLRIHEGKQHCLILDFAGNIERLGPINDVFIKEPGKKQEREGKAPIKTCPECNTHVPAVAKKCYICDYEFPQKESKDLCYKASTKQAVSERKESQQQWFNVDRVSYSFHSGPRGTSLRVKYLCGLRQFSEWFAIGRDNYGGTKAAQWWTMVSKWRCHPEYRIPKTVKEAVKRAQNGELYEPKRIYVEPDGAYFKVKSHFYK